MHINQITEYFGIALTAQSPIECLMENKEPLKPQLFTLTGYHPYNRRVCNNAIVEPSRTVEILAATFEGAMIIAEHHNGLVCSECLARYKVF